MGTPSSSAVGPEKQQKKQRTGQRRAAAAAWLAVIGVVVEQGAQGLFSGQPPAFLAWLGSVVSLQGDRPLWLKVLSLLAVVLVVASLGWLMYLAWLKTQDDSMPTHVKGGIAIAGCVERWDDTAACAGGRLKRSIEDALAAARVALARKQYTPRKRGAELPWRVAGHEQGVTTARHPREDAMGLRAAYVALAVLPAVR